MTGRYASLCYVVSLVLSEYLFSSFVAEIRLNLDFVCLGMFVYIDDDYRTMLAKIASLQEANVAMQQKLQVRRATKPRRVQLFVIITSCANLDK